jgi:hypothetical protein
MQKTEAKIKRLPNWETRLATFVEQSYKTNFGWGVNDCGAMAAGSIEALTGVDLFQEYHYNTALGLKRYMKRNDLNSLCDIPPRHNLQQINPNQMMRGDIAVAIIDDQETFVVNLGSQLFIRGKNGCIQVMKNEVKILKAWRVG